MTVTASTRKHRRDKFTRRRMAWNAAFNRQMCCVDVDLNDGKRWFQSNTARAVLRENCDLLALRGGYFDSIPF